jgi:hypothetical protein
MYIATGTIVAFLFLLRLQNFLSPSENSETGQKPAVQKHSTTAKIKS